ncbi:MAG TPA: DUF2892 domain-containing protein [Parvularculaceae bacterium]|nr:DUF2892 domain-containing protein [Parvularculaceae bacterium]
MANMGVLDRIIRLIASAALIWFFVAGGQTVWGYAALVVAVVLAATAIIGSCPLYAAFGIRTKKAKST